jgi:glycerol-3-phosphate acyltransferase PlsY
MEQPPLWAAALWVLGAYLSGSIPFGWIVFRILRGGDIRDHGSGNIGATNLMRFCGKGWAAAVLLLDALKGAVPVLAARLAGAPSWLQAAVAVAAVVGHCYTVFLRFRGGKGVATGLGVFAAMAPLAVLCSLAAFLAVAVPTRIVSLGSVTASITAPLWMWILGYGPVFVVAGAICALLLVWRHRANIARLIAGREARVGRKP